MFEEFDFTLLDDPGFKEDSVREELIYPLLRRLGYSASPPNQITRSPVLLHPYVYIGSKPHKINIVPDYLIKRDGQPFFILDAKRPSEEIVRGVNVEQAYSYAIHKDVRAEVFALCNGREFALFHISHWPALLTFSLADTENAWSKLAAIIGTDAVQREATFHPDLGIGMVYLGFAVDQADKKVVQIFSSLDIQTVARVDDETYSIQSRVGIDDTFFLGTFDFRREQLDAFVQCVEPPNVRKQMRHKLCHNPFTWRYDQDGAAWIGLACQLGDELLTNKDEQYIPFVVREFV